MVRIAESDAEVTKCWSVMKELRPHLTEDDFLIQVHRQQRNGYRLAYLSDGDRPVAVAGFHVGECLAVGRYLYVDDLVTSETDRSKGHGSALLEWLCVLARGEACRTLRLDSALRRMDARRFYEREGVAVSGYHFLKDLQT